MQYKNLPGSDISVSQLCFGCWGVTGDMHWGQREENESIGAMSAALDAGINFFDTAPLYGDGASESLLGRVLKQTGKREKIVIATKIKPDKMAADDIAVECEESLQRLQTDYIDLYQTHWTNREVPLEESWEAMQRLQQQGKVRQIGVCNMGLQDLNAVTPVQKPITNQLPYNLLWRMIEPQILPRCIEQQIGVLIYSPLMHGMLADKFRSADEVPDGRARSRHFSGQRSLARHGEDGCEELTFETIDRIRAIASEQGRTMADLALAWLLQQEGITSVIAGARNAKQLQQNLVALDQPLDDATVGKLNDATDELKAALGDNPDMWDGGSASRYR